VFSPESGPAPPPTHRTARCSVPGGGCGPARFLSFEFEDFHGVTPVGVHRKQSVAAGSQHPILRVHKSTVGHDRAHILSGNENAGIRRLRDTGTGCRPSPFGPHDSRGGSADREGSAERARFGRSSAFKGWALESEVPPTTIPLGRGPPWPSKATIRARGSKAPI